MASSAALLAGGVGLGAIVAASVMLVSQRRETRRGRSKLQLQDTDEMGFRKFVECNETLRAELEEQRQAVQEQKVAMEAYEREVLELRRKLQTAGEGGEAERPPLFKVVLTGGPCGGKTTAKSEIKARFESLGFLVLCGPEAATLLFGGGVPFPDDEAARMLLQRTILKLQMAIEDMFEEIGKNSGRPTLILLDRGALDGKAYVSDYEWELLLDDVKLTTVVLRDQRYDAIIHLVTAAQGAEAFYTLTNNETRTETPAAAREMDRKTLDAWTGHEHLYIVDNSTTFDEKIRRAVARISKLVGVPAPMAITRKFLLACRPTHEELEQHLDKFESFEVDTTFLRSNQNNKFGVYEKHRVRRRQQGANTSFQHQMWVTETRADGSEETHTIEKTLNAREYYILLKQRDPERCTISKTLSCFIWGTNYWELNAFKGATHVAILEVEAESRDSELCFPSFLPVAREVTDEESYDSYLIARELELEVTRANEEKKRANEEKGVPATSEGSNDEIKRGWRNAAVAAQRISGVLHTLETQATTKDLLAAASPSNGPPKTPRASLVNAHAGEKGSARLARSSASTPTPSRSDTA